MINMDTLRQNSLNIRSFIIFTGIMLFSKDVSTLDVVAGNEVILVCPLDSDYPEWTGPSNLNSPLTNGTEVIEAGFEWSGTKDLKINNANTMNTGEYKCSNGSTEGLVELNVLSYHVSVELLNTERMISVAVLKVTHGEDLTVECQVTNGNPAPTVTFRWQESLKDLPDLSNVTGSISDMETDNTYTVNASVTFKADIAIVDDTQLYCVASFDEDVANETTTSAFIFVLYPPTEKMNGVTQYPTEDNDTAVIFCSAYSKPGSSYFWMADDTALSSTNFEYSVNVGFCQTAEDQPYLVICRSDLIIDLKKENNGVVFQCIYIFEGQNMSVQNVYTADVPFSPTEVTITGDPSATVDLSGTANVTLSCQTNGGNPAPALRWYVGSEDGELINTTMFAVTELEDLYNGVNVTQQVVIEVNKTMDNGLITCCTAADKVCNSTQLSISYPPEILAPQLSKYRVYVDTDIVIPCVVDSNPDSVIVWNKITDSDRTHGAAFSLVKPEDSNNMISNNTNSKSNTYNLEIVGVTKNDSGMYECKAWLHSLGPETAVSKTTTIEVLDVPPWPLMSVYMEDNSPYVRITTNAEPPVTPRKFYLQYRKLSGAWLEIAQPYSDTQPGQGVLSYDINFQTIDLQPNTKYDIRIKSIDEYGLDIFSSVQSFTTSSVPEVDDQTVSRTQYRNAILLSVFVTAGVFLIIILLIVCAVKNGKCQSSSSKSYVM